MTGRALRLVVLDLAAVALLVSVAVIGFGPTFDGPQYLVAGFGALALGRVVYAPAKDIVSALLPLNRRRDGGNRHRRV